MLTAILAFFQVIPSITGGITAFSNAFFNAKVQITAARLGADSSVIRAAMTQAGIEAQARVQGLAIIASSKVLLAVVVGFAVPWIAFEWKVVIWDTMLGWGTTPPVRGLVADWSGIILTGIFGSSSALALSNAYFNRKNQP